MSEQPSRDELIRGLAVLRLADPVAYGQERKAVAKKLGCGLRYLDQAVEAEARRLAVQGAAPKEEADPDELEAEGRVVLDSEDVLAALRPVLRHLGYAGSTAPVELVYLALHSRLLLRPLNLLLGGTSSAGKTFTLDMATWLHPPEALHDLTGASEKALIYMEGDFQHKYVAIAEASALQQDGLAASIVRSLAWGKGLTYSTVEKDATGRLVSRMIEKPGPTGLITTSTKGLEPELTTRLLEVPIPENVELTRQIMRSQAETAAGTAPPEPDRAPWIAAARWLEIAGRRHVVIPFARQLAEVVPADDVRLRRDFTQILTVISTHALIHQRTRDQDSQGRVVADIDDYEATRHLLVDVLAVTIDSIPETVRETIETVQAMLSQHPAGVTVVML
ncbi:MAG: hypothetical protein ACREX3_05680, partial [Gammaproteobacteria bacterium]